MTIYNETVTGGARLNSTATTNYLAFITTSSGVRPAGAGTISKNIQIIGNDGLVADGNAKITYRSFVTAKGGSLISGIAQVIKKYEFVTTGGALTGSTVKPLVRYNPVVTGGLRVNGSSTVRIDFMATGGIKAGGESIVEDGYITFGGIRANGVADIKVLYTITLSGGVKVGGKARIAKRTFFNKVRTGYSRTLTSESILKPMPPLLIQTYGSVTPLGPTGVRTQAAADWNEIIESGENVLAPITIKRQRPYLPQKRRGTVTRNNQFAVVS